MPRKSDTDGSEADVAPEVQSEPVEIVTLKLRQRAYWRGELCEAGHTFDYTKAEADHLRETTELFD